VSIVTSSNKPPHTSHTVFRVPGFIVPRGIQGFRPKFFVLVVAADVRRL
jgi:hypothetical protein